MSDQPSAVAHQPGSSRTSPTTATPRPRRPGRPRRQRPRARRSRLAGRPVAAALADLAAYPDPAPARAAVAARHGRHPDEVLLTAGAAEAFVLLARALRGVRRPVVVHPQFTEPEAALRAAGHPVERVLLDAADGFRLDPARVPADADLVVIGNPTNPTSVLHPAADRRRAGPPRPGAGGRRGVRRHHRPGRPGEPESLADRRDLPGLLVVRSLTKTWGLAGLRVGYLLGAGRAAVAGWPPSSRSGRLHARAGRRAACASAVAVAGRRAIAAELAADRDAPGRAPAPNCPAYASSAAPPARSSCCTCRAPRGPGRAARARLGGPPRRHLPRPRPGLAAGRRARPKPRTDAFIDVLRETTGGMMLDDHYRGDPRRRTKRRWPRPGSCRAG